MKNYFFLLLFSAFIFQSCDDENPEPTPVSVALNHGGDFVTAPELPAGTYHATAVFTGDDIAGAIGSPIEEIEIYFANRPSSLSLYGYSLNEDGTPSSDISAVKSITVSDITPNSWNKFSGLSSSFFSVFEEENLINTHAAGIAIAAVISHDETMSSIGVDAGPANVNGDWLYLDASSEWTNLRDYTNNGTNANWSIRAKTGN